MKDLGQNVLLAYAVYKKMSFVLNGFGLVEKINIEIPVGLFYLPETSDNGNEHKLEKTCINIMLTGQDDRDFRSITIEISEDSTIEAFLSSNEESQEPSSHLSIQTNYQVARSLIFVFVEQCSPYSLNLITK